MEEEFRAILLGASAVTDICSNRVNFGANPQGSGHPSIVLNTISGFESVHMNGTGPFEGRVQVDCYADTYGAANGLSRAVMGALHFYRGGGFLMIANDAVRDTREGGSNEADRPYRSSLDFTLTWRPI